MNSYPDKPACSRLCSPIPCHSVNSNGSMMTCFASGRPPRASQMYSDEIPKAHPTSIDRVIGFSRISLETNSPSSRLIPEVSLNFLPVLSVTTPEPITLSANDVALTHSTPALQFLQTSVFQCPGPNVFCPFPSAQINPPRISEVPKYFLRERQKDSAPTRDPTPAGPLRRAETPCSGHYGAPVRPRCPRCPGATRT